MGFQFFGWLADDRNSGRSQRKNEECLNRLDFSRFITRRFPGRHDPAKAAFTPELLAIYLPAGFRWLFLWGSVKGDRSQLAFPFGSGQQFQSEPFGEVIH